MGWEDPLEKGKAAHSSILAWRIPRTVWGHKESDMTERHSLSLNGKICIFEEIVFIALLDNCEATLGIRGS